MPEDDETRFAQRLANLKQSGGALLVTGEVDEQTRTWASQTLFGDIDQPRRRVLLCVGSNGHPNSYFPLEVFSGDSRVRAIVDEATVRNGSNTLTASTDSSVFHVEGPTAEPVTPTAQSTREATLEELEMALLDSIHDIVNGEPLDAGELRVGVATLSPLIARFGIEPVVAYCRSIANTVRDYDGMVHFHLPLTDEAARESQFATIADARVELRHETRVECLWHLTSEDTDITAGWLPL